MSAPAATHRHETTPSEPTPSRRPSLLDNRYLPPLFITLILAAAHWTFGVLDNGLRYAVKRNIVPAGQVSIRVRVDAGALHEDDDQLGFAHLMEHLAFRGSEHVPDGEAKRIWQRFGASFGSVVMTYLRRSSSSVMSA